MSKGIDSCQLVLVFITKNYVQKVASNNAADNCKLEFNYAAQHLTGSFMLPIVMEADMKKTVKWKGSVGLVCGSSLFFCCDNDDDFDRKMDDLYDAITRIICPILGNSNRPRTVSQQKRIAPVLKAKAGTTPYAINSSTSTSTTTKELESLTTEEVSELLQSLKIPFNKEDLLKNMVDGKTLIMVHNANEFTEIGLPLPAPKARILLKDLKNFQVEGGVPLNLINGGATVPVPVNTATRKSAIIALESLPTFDNIFPMNALPLEVLSAPDDTEGLTSSLDEPEPSTSTSSAMRRRDLLKSYSVEDAITAVTEAIHPANIENIELAQHAFNIIPEAINSDYDNQLVLGGSEVFLRGIISLLEYHKNNSMVVESAMISISALCCLAEDSSAVCEPNLEALCEAGICDLITTILRLHQNEESVVIQACWAMTHLNFNCAFNKTAFGDAGACELIPEMAKKHLSSSTMAEALCRAMASLATSNSKNNVKLGDAGACEVVATIMKSHPSEPALAEAGCKAVMNLAFGNASNKNKLGEQGACEAVLLALQSFSWIATVAELGCWAIMNLVANCDENNIKLGEVGACDILVAIMEAHQTDEVVIESAYRAVTNLSSNTANNIKFDTSGICELMASTLQFHFANTKLVEHGCWSVTNLAGNKDINIKLGTVGICEIVLDALKIHGEVSDLAKRGCMAIYNLSENVANRDRIVLAGGKGVLRVLADDSTLSDAARNEAKEALTVLN
eukprot:gene121-181_t